MGTSQNLEVLEVLEYDCMCPSLFSFFKNFLPKKHPKNQMVRELYTSRDYDTRTAS